MHLQGSWKCVKLTGDVAVIMAFAEKVSVWVIRSAAVILAFAAEVSAWMICVDSWRRSYIGVAEEVSVWVICGVAVIMAFAVEVSLWVICGAAFILAFGEEEVSLWVIWIKSEWLTNCQTCKKKRVLQKCQQSVSSQSVLQECQIRVS